MIFKYQQIYLTSFSFDYVFIYFSFLLIFVETFEKEFRFNLFFD